MCPKPFPQFLLIAKIRFNLFDCVVCTIGYPTFRNFVTSRKAYCRFIGVAKEARAPPQLKC